MISADLRKAYDRMSLDDTFKPQSLHKKQSLDKGMEKDVKMALQGQLYDRPYRESRKKPINIFLHYSMFLRNELWNQITKAKRRIICYVPSCL